LSVNDRLSPAQLDRFGALGEPVAAVVSNAQPADRPPVRNGQKLQVAEMTFINVHDKKMTIEQWTPPEIKDKVPLPNAVISGWSISF
jgi:hypothetical protein